MNTRSITQRLLAVTVGLACAATTSVQAQSPSPTPAPTSAAPDKAKSEKAPLRIAVYDLAVSGVDPKVGRIVTDSVVSELRKLQRISVVSMDEVRAMLALEADKQTVGCSEASCLAEIAEALGVDGLVIGTLADVDGSHVFGLKRIDQHEAKTLGTVNQRLEAAGGEEFLAAIGPAVAELFPEHALKPGQARGVPDEVALRLNPPPLPTWVFWSSAATTGAVLVGAAGAATLNRVEKAQLDAYTSSADGKTLEGAVFVDHANTIETTAYLTWALVTTATVGAAATGVVALFTDWNGHGSEVSE